MNICLAQIRPKTGDIAFNIARHQAFVHQAAGIGAEMIIFPELSISSYEPELAEALAMEVNDARLDVFQSLSNKHNMTIGVGAPIRQTHGISISMLLFQPKQEPQIYSKYYLHADEEPFFVPGEQSCKLWGGDAKVTFAICYEISVREHAEQAVANGAQIYVASVAKFVNGMEAANGRLDEVARSYGMPVLMSNCLGIADGGECAGQSAVWNAKGDLLGQLNDSEEGLLLYNSITEVVETHYFSPVHES